jgi:hypothetical protein
LEPRNPKFDIEIEFTGYPDIRLSGSGYQDSRVSGLITLHSLTFPDILMPGILRPDSLITHWISPAFAEAASRRQVLRI